MEPNLTPKDLQRQHEQSRRDVWARARVQATGYCDGVSVAEKALRDYDARFPNPIP